VRIGIQRGVQGFALSFVRTFTQISQSADFVKQELQAAGKTGRFTYLLKIEDPIGVRNLKFVLAQCKQVNLNVIVLAARGDLFTEMPQEDLPLVQEAIITVCHDAKVPVMVGTGIFTTMQRKPVPSRAEYVDVFHMCRQGVDWVLLSDETSNSKYPVEVVKLLNAALRKYAISEA
jgi:pyruvate kinase